jgi:calcineurin-like phosphoesterase family protein
MSKNPQYFYTTDTHLFHRLVAQDRGFFVPGSEMVWSEQLGKMVGEPDVQAHADTLAHNWDSVVRPQDTVFVMGDISINGSDAALEWHRERPGTKILIMGNHDPVWPFHRDAPKHFQKWSEVFTGGMFPFLRRKLGKKYFLLSHFPYTGTGAEGHGVEDRYPQFRLPDLGVPLLHGHTHGKERHHVSDKGTPQLHVGLDAWDMQLVHQDTVQGWLEHPDSSFYL